MGHLIPYYMLLNAGHPDERDSKDVNSTSSSDKPLENKSVTSNNTTDDTEVKTETRVPSKPVENYDKGLQNGMFFSGIIIGAMLMFFIMMFYNEHKAREAKIEALERKIRELEMEKLYKR
jgi:hypothetical protein|nr:MAG TPA: Lipopolysaccharide assembly protein A domain [Caudoviricetes sp.]